MDFDYSVPQYLGQVGEFYNQGFNFPLESYPNLSNESHLPPAPSDIFTGYPQVYPPAPAYPHMSVSSAQGQMYPHSISEYPSNGSYPWTSSPPHASLQPPTYFPPVSAPPVPQGLQDDDQKLPEMYSLFDPCEGYGGYEGFYGDPQAPAYVNNSNLGGSSSPYNWPGQDFNDASPPASLVKPPPELEDNYNQDDTISDFRDDEEINMEDLQNQLPDGITERHLLTLKIPDLNKLLKDLGLDKEDQNLVKRIRRQYKNRGYANTCRKKKEERKSSMKEQKQTLQVEINELKDDVEKLRLERDRYKRNYEIMQQTKKATAAMH
ncbi:hypothetical protein LOD99_15431 [Oopsacas minuta]|uniref:BZIP domain-containing protein n=1 Tax=Oopsacas minuta TaxID=111878 RepID=A0AAV7KBS1_9METZ|nr:hypothetical protein LOD99_15431 [Oopsacas minuta]